MGSLDGRVALVTGASRGIGAATARALAAQGAHLVLVARSEDDLKRLAKELPDAVALPTDLRDADAIERLVSRAQSIGPIDILVHAAGLGSFAAIDQTTIETWDETMDVNLRAAFALSRLLVPGMRARGRGHIVTIVSVAGVRAFPNATAYCASKFGLLGFTRALHEEVRRDGVKVSAIVPGSVDTPFWERAGLDLPRDQMLRPEAVADAVVYVVTAPANVHHDEVTVMPPSGVL